MTHWNRKDAFAFAIVLLVAAFFVFAQFLTKPFIWSDESLNIQMARNLSEFGKITIQLAPGVFTSNVHYYTSSTGWVMLASVALAFKIFGASFFVARLVMAAYAFGFLFLTFVFVRRRWGWRAALASGLLMTTFAPFLGNGKSVLGEIPGLFWLALGMWCWDVYANRPWERALFSGLGFGLFLATKPAFLYLGGPALGVLLLIELIRRRISAASFFQFWLAAAVVVSPTVWNGIIHPVSLENLRNTAIYYSNNYNSPCISCDVQKNLYAFFTQTTFWHLEMMMFFAVFALTLTYKTSLNDWRVRWVIVFAALDLLYFIKSPGTNRYLLPLQIFLLAVFPIALEIVVRRIRPGIVRFIFPVCIALAVLQGMQYFFFSDVYSNTSQPALEKFIREKLSTTSGPIGVVDAPIAGAVVPSERLLQFVRNNAYDRTDGVNPLTLPPQEWPPVLILGRTRKNEADMERLAEQLAERYPVVKDFHSFIVYLSALSESE